MLSCSKFERRIQMELEQRDERYESNPQRRERVARRDEQSAVKPPFASEGLEQVRDSHC